MGDIGDYWRDVNAYFKGKKQKHDNAVDNTGLDVMEESIKKAGLTIQSDHDVLKPRWRISNSAGKWIDFWPHTGTLYQPQQKLHDWESDWSKVGKKVAKILSTPLSKE